MGEPRDVATMSTIRVNGIDIRYEILGPSLSPVAQGPSPETVPLVLTHGFAGPIDNWRPELLPLAEKRTLVLYDVRGHGRTSVPADEGEYSLPAFAADMAGLLRALGIERAHVGGVSMGGMVTAQFAVDYPDLCQSVLLCDTTCGNAAGSAQAGPAGDWERRLKMGMGLLAQSVRERGMEETLYREQEWKKANDPHLAESPYSFEEDLERIKLMTPAGYLGAARAIIERPDLTWRIPQIAAPTLVMIGEWDDFLPCALRDHELIPGSRLVVRRRCAHGSRWRAETFLSEIETFLDDVEAGRTTAGRYEV
ncbi:MAG: alpha/beta hydrolase [Dehalococcoidia bacterium]|nr:alpha/beta hydrolase [Dehalococcoidia bacterium]